MGSFEIVLTKDEDDPTVLNVSVPLLPGCHTWGKGKRQALKRAREAIALYIESVKSDEAWLYRNKSALEQVLRGLEQGKKNEVTSLGRFSKPKRSRNRRAPK